MPGFVDAPSRSSYEDYNEGEVPKVGLYKAVLQNVGDIFERHDAKYDKISHSLWFTWELPGAMDSKGRPFRVSKRYNVFLAREGGRDGQPKLDAQGKYQMLRPDQSKGTRQSLGIDLNAWGVEMPKSGRLEDLVGQWCQLFITNSPKEKGGFFANVESIVPLQGDTNANDGGKPEDPLPF